MLSETLLLQVLFGCVSAAALLRPFTAALSSLLRPLTQRALALLAAAVIIQQTAAGPLMDQPTALQLNGELVSSEQPQSPGTRSWIGFVQKPAPPRLYRRSGTSHRGRGALNTAASPRLQKENIHSQLGSSVALSQLHHAKLSFTRLC